MWSPLGISQNDPQNKEDTVWTGGSEGERLGALNHARRMELL